MTWAPMMSLSDVAEGGLFSDGDWVESKDQDPSGTVRLTQLADVGVGEFRDRSDRWLRPDQASALRCTFLKAGDVLIARMPDPIGRACLAPPTIGTAVTAVDVSILRIGRPDVDARYVMWAINSPRFHAEVEARQSGTTRKRISRKNLGALNIPVPPLDEQRRIVDLLEDHLSRLDAAQAYLDAALRRAEMLRWGSVAEAVSTAGGGEVRLGDIASVRNGIFVSRPGSEPNGVPILRIGAVRSLSLDLSDLRYSERTEEDLREADGLAQPGDLLFTRYNGNPQFVGACATVPEDAPALTYPDKLIRVRMTDDAALPEFVALACSVGAARAQIQASVRTTAGQAGIAGRDLKNVTLTLPDIEAQRAAIRAASESGIATARLSHELETAKRRAAALGQSLLAAAFTGGLTGAGSDPSQAEEMVNA